MEGGMFLGLCLNHFLGCFLLLDRLLVILNSPTASGSLDQMCCHCKGTLGENGTCKFKQWSAGCSGGAALRTQKFANARATFRGDLGYNRR